MQFAREDGDPRWRAKAELPPVGERVQSPYDPEMHYSIKGQLVWYGYKVHVTETCDADTAHLITHVETCPAMQPDMTSTATIHARLAAKGLLPREHFVDSGYVDAAVLASSQRDHGVSLEGPVRGVSSRQTRTGEGYDQSHVTIDWAREQVTCPKGKTSVAWRAGRDAAGHPRIYAQFGRADCSACAARAQCAPPSAARRVVHFPTTAPSTTRYRRQGRACTTRCGRSATACGPGSRARSRRACARSGCAGAGTSGWRRPGCSRRVPPRA